MFSKRFVAAITRLAAVIQQSAAGTNTQARDTYISVLHDFHGQNASDYEVSVEGISLTDTATDISDIEAIHNGRPFDVIANLKWEEQIFDIDSSNILFWEMSINGVPRETGSVDLSAVS